MATTSPQYPRGSEWRKWDIQIHTPFSALSNGFGSDFNEYAKQMLTTAVRKEIAVVGITDYFCIEGYKELRKLLQDGVRLEQLVGKETAAAVQAILFVPNVELRTSIIIRAPKGADSRVNFHVIFSDGVPSHNIEEDFLRELKFTAEGNPMGVDERWPLTLRNLEELGKRLKTQHGKFSGQSDVFVGMMNAVIDHGEVTSVLEKKPSIFKDKYLFCLPSDEDLSKCSWDGQGHLTRKVLIQKSHLLFSSNEGTRQFALGKRHNTQDDFVQEFKALKPCLHSSDAHSFADLFEPKERRYTWIKADPTFEGLKQILNEPEDRVVVAPIPQNLQRVANRATRIAKQLEIRRSPDATTRDRWFDVSVPLNSELVAVIGNKGSGKSALADILGLLGNTPRHSSFSFLNAERFRKLKDNKARQFQASLLWADTKTDGPISLDQNPASDSVERMKYIPQHYLEEICNEIGLGKGGRFYAELQQVIFAHVPESERLGFSTLEELLEHRSEETHKAIDLLVSKLRETNKQVAELEDRLAPQHRRALEAQLAEKQRELEAHDQSKPKEVKKPDEDEAAKERSKEISDAIEKEEAQANQLEQEIAKARGTESQLAQRHSVAEKLVAKLENLQREVDGVLSETSADFAELGLTQDEVVTFKLNVRPIKKLINNINKDREQIAKQLDGDSAGSLQHKLLASKTKIEQLQKQLSAKQQEYQTYLQKLKDWTESRARIVGSAKAVGSIAHINSQLSKLDGIPKLRWKLMLQRARTVRDIYREKRKLCDYYAAYYGYARESLQRHPLSAKQEFKLTFNVAVVEKGFADGFLNLINQRKIGPFAGKDEGLAELNQILEAANFDSSRGVLRFLTQVVRRMMEHNGRQLAVKDQLAQDVGAHQLYDAMYSLGYLSPIYNLEWDGKGVEQLSAGERGNLLLIFYLLVDPDGIPLVIDQPEENLDNQTVFKTLVPCIKDAKKRRQIIMVTHNPNLAVVCDAEQIIYAEIHKERGNEVTYLSGSIEEPLMNRKIVDVLEGTRPAFDKREAKYQR